jgi:hypothetical protein
VSRSELFASARSRAVEAFLGVSNPETRPTFCASDEEAITGAPALLDACEDEADTIVDELAQLCGWSP